MPIYEYQCEDCNTKFEKLVRRPEAAEVACPSCGKQHVSQQYSTFAAHANGAASPARSEAPACPGGMCRSPGFCGMN